ncbi:hypothetical protein Tco_1345576 [Tanacetum coccineum]
MSSSTIRQRFVIFEFTSSSVEENSCTSELYVFSDLEDQGYGAQRDVIGSLMALVSGVRLESQSEISLSLALQTKEVETLSPLQLFTANHMGVNSMSMTLDGSFVKLELLRMPGYSLADGIYLLSGGVVPPRKLNSQSEKNISKHKKGGFSRTGVLSENGVTRPKKYSELSATKAIQDDWDIKANNIISKGLQPEVMHWKISVKLYENSIVFLYEVGRKFVSFYLRLSLLLNDMNSINMKLEQFQVNIKFLNTLPPEWSKFMADVKLFLEDRLVSWSSKRQKSVAISSTEAGIYCYVWLLCSKLLGLRSQFDNGLGFNKIPMSKHIDIRFHFIKEHVENGVIELYFVNTEYQLANLPHSPYKEKELNFLSNSLGMRSFTPETLKHLTDEVDE